jgi:hypothetical protein
VLLQTTISALFTSPSASVDNPNEEEESEHQDHKGLANQSLLEVAVQQ